MLGTVVEGLNHHTVAFDQNEEAVSILCWWTTSVVGFLYLWYLLTIMFIKSFKKVNTISLPILTMNMCLLFRYSPLREYVSDLIEQYFCICRSMSIFTYGGESENQRQTQLRSQRRSGESDHLMPADGLMKGERRGEAPNQDTTCLKPVLERLTSLCIIFGSVRSLQTGEKRGKKKKNEIAWISFQLIYHLSSL